MILSFNNFVNENNINISNKDWYIQQINNLIRTTKTREKYFDYLNKIYSFSENSQTFDKKEFTKIKNDLDNLIELYYNSSEQSKIDFDKLVKDKGYYSYLSMKDKDNELYQKYNFLAFINFQHFLINVKRTYNTLQKYKDNLSKDELNYINKYAHNLDKWIELQNKIEEIEKILNPSKEIRQINKLKEIKGTVNDKIKSAIDEIAERFRIVIENHQYDYYTKITEKLKKDYPICIQPDDFWKIYKNYNFIAKTYTKETNKSNSAYILTKNYNDIIKQISFDESKSIILNFTLKMYDKLGGFITDLNKDFIVTTTSDKYQNNYIDFKFNDNSRFTIKNQIIHKISNLGTPFYTYNTTFHNVFLSNGDKINNPNEYTIKKGFNEYYNKTNENIEYVDGIISEIDDFLASPSRNNWIYYDDIKIYIRKSHRGYNGKLIPCLDLATIEIDNSGQGKFTNILTEILERYKDKNIFVESILEKRFYNFLLNHGFEKMPQYSDCLIKIATI